MQAVAAREFQKNFGVFSDSVMADTCLNITQNGRPAYFVLPHNAQSEEAARRMAGQRLVRNLRASKASEAAKALTFDDITRLVDESLAEESM